MSMPSTPYFAQPGPRSSYFYGRAMQTCETPHAWGARVRLWSRPTLSACVGRAWGESAFGRGAKLRVKSDEFRCFSTMEGGKAGSRKCLSDATPNLPTWRLLISSASARSIRMKYLSSGIGALILLNGYGACAPTPMRLRGPAQKPTSRCHRKSSATDAGMNIRPTKATLLRI